jgi:hypothetical protein
MDIVLYIWSKKNYRSNPVFPPTRTTQIFIPHPHYRHLYVQNDVDAKGVEILFLCSTKHYIMKTYGGMDV